MLSADSSQINIELKSVLYKGEILAGYGLFTIEQVYLNNSDLAANTTFRFPLPENSNIVSFDIRSSAKHISSGFSDKDDADALADNAMRKGFPSELFTIEPNGLMIITTGRLDAGDRISLSVTYLQKLRTSLNKTEIVLPAVIKYAEVDTQISIRCFSASSIIKVDSPNYKIFFEGSSITSSGYFNNKEVILHIYEANRKAPAIYHKGKNCIVSFTPEFEVKQRPCGFDYIFILDASASMKDGKFERAKNALLSCLAGLQQGDTFNIIAFESICHHFSLFSQPYGTASLKSAARWLDSLTAMGRAKLVDALEYAYEMGHSNSLIFLVAGDIPDDFGNIIDFLKKQNKCSLYAIGMEPLHQPFFNNLSVCGNGKSPAIAFGDSFEDNMLALFNHISTSYKKDVRLTTDPPLDNMMPNKLSRSYAGETAMACADRMFGVPRRLTLNTPDYTEEFVLRDVPAGEIVKYISALLRLQLLNSELTSEGSEKNLAIIKEIKRISVSNNINNALSILTMTVNSTAPDGTSIEVTMPYKTVKGRAVSASTHFSASNVLCLLQADGSWGSENETAEKIISLFENTSCPTLYRWHIRKAIAFLFASIERGSYDVISKEVIKAFDYWLEHFPEDTIFAKKIEALVFMNRN